MTPCWQWLGYKSNGYGVRKIGGRNGKLVRVHRHVYEQLVGPIPAGLDLDHLCRNRACYNPEHLEPVTRAENLRRSREANGIAQGARVDVHGTRARYSYGCRCGECREANAGYSRRYRDAGAA